MRGLVRREVRLRRTSRAGALAVVAVSLAACGQGAGSAVVARVGRASVTKGALTHWISVMAPGGQAPDPPHYTACTARRRSELAQSSNGRPALTAAELAAECRQRYLQMQAGALEYLISAQWVIGEAADDGLTLTDGQVTQSLEAKRRRSFPGGRGEFEEFLKAAHQTVADAMLEARVELAKSEVYKRAVSLAHSPTSAEVASYYHQHQQSFVVPERREVEITNRKSAAEGERLKREVAHGLAFATIAKRETLSRTTGGEPALKIDTLTAAALERAVFSAKPNVLAGPVRRRVDYYVFEVMRIVPARLLPLPQVAGAIERQLSAERQRLAVADFVAGWRRKWTARTSCLPAYVVQKCRQYSGPRKPEDPLGLS